MSQTCVVLEESFAVPPETLYAALADHEGMSEWIGARVSIVSGPPEGGVGTVRRVRARGLAIDEEVTYEDAPRRMVYRIVRGAPGLRFHRGEILVEPWGETGSRLRWDICLESPLPGLSRLLALTLEPTLRQGLTRLRARL